MNNIELSGMGSIAMLILLVALVLGVIFYFKTVLGKGVGTLTEKHKDTVWASPLIGRAKYPEVDGFKF